MNLLLVLRSDEWSNKKIKDHSQSWEVFFFLSGTLPSCHWPIRYMWSCFEKYTTVDTCIIIFVKIHYTLSPNQKRDSDLTYNNSNYRSYHNNYHNSYYYRCYHHHLRRFEIFLESSDWLVHQLAHNNLSLAVKLEIQTPKDANRKFKKQNKCKISKFYFQLLTHTHKKKQQQNF